MGGRAKKGRFLRRYIGLVSITFILALSAVGIGYGAWNDGLETEMTVKTGEFEPEIIITKVECYYFKLIGGRDWYEKNSDNWEAPLSGNNINFKARWAKAHKKYRIHFMVKNEGTIPIKYKLDDYYDNNDRMKVVLNESKPYTQWKTLGKNQSQGNNYIQVETDGVGLFKGMRGTFEVKLKVKQWNL